MSDAPKPPKLLDRLRAKVRLMHYSLRTEEAYVDWARRQILSTTSVTPLRWKRARSKRF